MDSQESVELSLDIIFNAILILIGLLTHRPKNIFMTQFIQIIAECRLAKQRRGCITANVRIIIIIIIIVIVMFYHRIFSPYKTGRRWNGFIATVGVWPIPGGHLDDIGWK